MWPMGLLLDVLIEFSLLHIAPLKRGMALHLNHLEFPSTKMLCARFG